jgi:hypothetical protein
MKQDKESNITGNSILDRLKYRAFLTFGSGFTGLIIGATYQAARIEDCQQPLAYLRTQSCSDLMEPFGVGLIWGLIAYFVAVFIVYRLVNKRAVNQLNEVIENVDQLRRDNPAIADDVDKAMKWAENLTRTRVQRYRDQGGTLNEPIIAQSVVLTAYVVAFSMASERSDDPVTVAKISTARIDAGSFHIPAPMFEEYANLTQVTGDPYEAAVRTVFKWSEHTQDKEYLVERYTQAVRQLDQSVKG